MIDVHDIFTCTFSTLSSRNSFIKLVSGEEHVFQLHKAVCLWMDTRTSRSSSCQKPCCDSQHRKKDNMDNINSLNKFERRFLFLIAFDKVCESLSLHTLEVFSPQFWKSIMWVHVCPAKKISEAWPIVKNSFSGSRAVCSTLHKHLLHLTSRISFIKLVCGEEHVFQLLKFFLRVYVPTGRGKVSLSQRNDPLVPH